MTSKLACQTRKIDHTYKEELGCVLGPLFKRYHKTSKLAYKYSTQHVFYPNKSNMHLSTQG